MALLCMGLMTAHAQMTPPNANSDAECGGDCYALFNWSPVDDGTGSNIEFYGEGVAMDANCNTIIEGAIEYDGNDTSIDASGTAFGANLQGNTAWTDTWTVTFGTDLTNPVFNFSGLFGDSKITIADCNGSAISVTDISSTDPANLTGMFSGDDQVQLNGTFNCVVVTVSNDVNDRYSISVGTCLGANPPPPCANCGTDESFSYLNLTGADGNEVGSTADVELGGIKIGDATILESTLTIGGDITGTAFGAFANGNDMEETFLMRIDLCQAITVQQLDVLGLETESQVWVGTSLDGMMNPTGLDLTSCGGTRPTMAVDAMNSSMVTNVSSSCSNQGNGKYTVAATPISTLFFRYTNPIGGCRFDKATFRIATCLPDLGEEIPVCPLVYQTYVTDVEDYLANGETNSNSFQVMKDGNGNFFGENCAMIRNDVAEPEGTNANGGFALDLVPISPCAELILEEDCDYCTPPPPPTTCTTCAETENYDYVTLSNYDAMANKGDVFLDGVLIGTSEVIGMSNVLREDLQGSRFGALANGRTEEETLILKLEFCEPTAIGQIDVLGLETQSFVNLGTSISGTTLSGLTVTQCEGTSGMEVEGMNIINNSPNCSNQGNGNYKIDPATVSTLYFKYTNPVPEGTNCRFDKTTYRIGICVPELEVITPECPLEVLEEVVTLADESEETNLIVRDANGKYFAYADVNAATSADLSDIEEIKISPCATINTVCGVGTEDPRDTKGLCGICFVPPVIGDVACTNGRPADDPSGQGNPIITQPFTITATGLENMKGADNNEKDFGLNAYLYPAGKTAADFAYPPMAISIADAVALGEQPNVPVLLGPLVLSNNCTEGSLTVVLPADFPQGDYAKVLTLDMAPTLDPESEPSFTVPELEVIPTMGQWALMILALLISSMALVYIRRTNNHEVKELS